MIFYGSKLLLLLMKIPSLTLLKPKSLFLWHWDLTAGMLIYPFHGQQTRGREVFDYMTPLVFFPVSSHRGRAGLVRGPRTEKIALSLLLCSGTKTDACLFLVRWEGVCGRSGRDACVQRRGLCLSLIFHMMNERQFFHRREPGQRVPRLPDLNEPCNSQIPCLHRFCEKPSKQVL